MSQVPYDDFPGGHEEHIDWYSENKTYNINDRVRYWYNGTQIAIYRCKVAVTTPKAWSAENWEFRTIDGNSESPEDSGGSGSYSTKTCKLIVRYNSGNHGDPPSESVVTYSGEKKEITLKRTIKSATDTMVWTDHYFIGWSTSSGSSSPDPNYDPGTIAQYTWDVNGSGAVTITLYAVWCEHGRIVYKPGRYANEANDGYHDRYQALPSSGNVTLRGAIFTRTGYNLVGWLLNNNNFGAIGASVDVSNLSGNVNLYPKWEAKTFTITFKPNGGNENQNDIVIENVAYDSELTLRDEHAFSKDGYHVSLWNESADGTKAVWFPGKTYTYTIERDLTLYAQWAGDEYYVIYCDSEEAAVNLGDNYNNLSRDDILATYRHSLAVYGSPFYTDYRPKSENKTFAGWKELGSTTPLFKKDVWMDAYSFKADPQSSVVDSTWTKTSDAILYPIWSNDYPFGKMFFGRKESSDYGIIINEPPSYSWPERPYTHKNIKGKNGDIIEDPNFYENVTKTYKITAYNKNDVQLAASNVSDFLHRYNGYGGYIRLEDSYEPDVYMMAIYEEKNELDSIIGQAWKTDLAFNCKPQKYLISGDQRIDVTSSGTYIRNPTNYPAFPLLKVWGTGTIYFWGRPTRVIDAGKISPTDNGTGELRKVMLSIYDNYNEINIDTETFDVTDFKGRNASSLIYLGDRIAFYPGVNEITYIGDIEKISIIPRWWRL